MPRGITAICCGSSFQQAELGGDGQAALLRHDQQLAVGL
jgi:hypothetical protein